MTDDPTACDRSQAEHEARFQRVQASPFFGQRLGERGPLRDYEDREMADIMQPMSWEEFSILFGLIAGIAVVLGIAAYKVAVPAFVGLLMLARAAGLV